MLKEFLDKLQSMADEARRIKTVPELSDHRVIGVDLGNGELKSIAKTPPPRRHTVHSIDSLCRAIERYRNPQGPTQDEASVWVSMGKVVAVLGDVSDVRCDSITLPLNPHDAFKLLHDPAWKNQTQMVDLLRHDLADCEIGPATTLDTLRSLRFQVNSEASGKLSNSSAILGKSVVSQIIGDVGSLPETVSIEFHPFPGLADEIDVNVVIYCTLFTKPEEGLLKLAPQPGQIEDAERNALDAIVERLDTRFMDNTPVFMGTP